jgi:hypothetical protein
MTGGQVAPADHRRLDGGGAVRRSIPITRCILWFPRLEPRWPEEARPRTAPVRRRHGTAVHYSGGRGRRLIGVLGS